MTSLDDKEKMGEIYFLRALNAIQDKPFDMKDIEEEDSVDGQIDFDNLNLQESSDQDSH